MPKYKYKFCDGTSAVIDVSDEQLALLDEIDRKEQTNNRRHQRKHTSLEVLQEQENDCEENDRGKMK